MSTVSEDRQSTDRAPTQSQGGTGDLTARVHRLLHRHPSLSPALVLLVTVVVFSMTSDRFLQPSNLSLVLQQVSIIGALAVGQTLIILTAGIDLSNGATMIMTTMVVGKLAGEMGVSGPIALLVGLGVGALAGLINGVLVAKVGLPPFIVTLGTWNVYLAISLLLTRGRSIGGDRLGPFLNWTATPVPIGPFQLTTGVIVVLAMYIMMQYALTQTAWGRHIYAVGDDRDAARLAGVKTPRLLISAYMVAGLVFALTAWVLIGRVGTASPIAGNEANLESITAVIVGGTSLFGGRGRLFGTFLGAVTVGVFRNGLAIARVDVLWQTLAIGVLIIVAVSLDQWIRRTRTGS